MAACLTGLVMSGCGDFLDPKAKSEFVPKDATSLNELLLGDLIEQQFLGGAYNPHLGAAISMVMMVIVVVCMVVMNHFGEGEEQAVML